jgi:hypothetical protein
MMDPPANGNCDPPADNLIFYLAERLNLSQEATLSYLGDWLIAFAAGPHPSQLRRCESGAPEELSVAILP